MHQDRAKEKIAKLADRGREDLLVLLREILGYNWVNEKEHRELCDFLMSKKRKKYSVIMAPRDTLKSTICSQGYPIWLMIRGKTDLRVLLDSEVRDHSKARLQGIQQKLETSKWFKQCYGDWDGRINNFKWNDEEATISARKNTSVRESTFETAGVDVVKNSRHYDLIIPDDCHSDKNTETRRQIESVIQHYKVLQPMLEPTTGEFIIVCTPWDDKDANMTFIELMGDDVSVFRRSAFKDDDKKIPRYPNRLPIETLKARRKIMGARLFGLQYLMECISEEDALFKEEDIRIIVDRDIPKLLRRYLLVDPAGDPTAKSEEKRDSDNWAIGLLEVSPSSNIYLKSLAWGTFSPTEGVEEILKMVMAYNPHVICIEKTGLGNTSFYVKEKLRQMGRFAMVEDFKPHGRSKTQRVSGLAPIVKMRKFHIASSCPFREETLEEFVKFTRFGSKAKHDDIPDMCSQIMFMVEKYGVTMDDSSESEALSREEMLMYLNPGSHKHWEAYHKKISEDKQTSWVENFV